MDNQYQHKARKRFGQNFLHDGHIINKLASAIAAKADDCVVEIGPGQGALTKPLLENLNHLNVIELDRDLIPILQQQFSSDKLSIHQADALKFDFASLQKNEQPLRIVGNLPYNISTPLIFHLLSYQQRIKDMHFMLQLEVVDRLAAQVGTKAYGRLSIICQYYCQVDKLFNVPPGAFNPPPKVMSAIVRLAPKPSEQLTANNEPMFEKLVKTAFAQRRKTLRNNLKQWLSSEQLELLDINLSLRPEQLTVNDFINISNQLFSKEHKQ